MGFLDRIIRNGIRQGVSDAIGKAVQQAVEPKATELANKAAESIDRAAGQTNETIRQTSGFEGAMANLERSMQGYATEAAKNMKVCPACKEPATADKKFCPKCGAKLPEATIAEGAVCTSCGKQNAIGTKFCSDCGTKLPAAIEEEQEEKARGESVMDGWDAQLAVYPKWNCGGIPVDIQTIETDRYIFIVDFKGDSAAARQGVAAYRQLALQNGFREAGEYPNKENLYKKIDGVCYHIDTEHCFDGDSDCPTIGFAPEEPYGGFDYVKPEPKKQMRFKDIFKF